MSLTFPDEIVDVYRKFPLGNVVCLIDSAKETTVEVKGVETKIFEVNLIALEPSEFDGATDREVFWLGSKEDPMCLKPDTLKTTAAKLKEFCGLMGIDIQRQNTDVLSSTLKGQKIGRTTNWKVNAKGYIDVRTASYYALGDRPTEVQDERMATIRDQARQQQSAGTLTGGSLPSYLNGNGSIPANPLPPSRMNAPLPVRTA